MRTIELTRGYRATVDDDASGVFDHKWCALVTHGGVYAVRGYRINGKMNYELMHRVIVGAPVGLEVDHRNGDTLDNRRANLRIATHAENMRNQKRSVRNRSGRKGVAWDRARGKWCASIQINGRTKSLGRYADIDDAARAYQSAALENFGQFARIGG